MSLIQYARFLAVGGAIGLICIGCRALIGFVLGADTAARYSISVLTAYAGGILLSFLINGRYTFKDVSGNPEWSSFPSFVLVAVTGLMSTWLLSVLIRYETTSWMALGRYSGTIAFAIATLTSTALTYPLNALLVFRRGQRSNSPAGTTA
jgi:putative flippase GtrA